MSRIFQYLLLLFIFLSCARSQKVCDPWATYQEQLANVSEEELPYYLPSKSCFYCTKRKCSDTKCDSRWSQTPWIPMYEHMFEFGLFYDSPFGRLEVLVNLSSNCGFKIFIDKPRNNIGQTIEWFECNDDPDYFMGCDDFRSFRYRDESPCVFITMKFLGTRTVYEASYNHCNSSSTGRLSDQKVFRLKECRFKKWENAAVKYQIRHERSDISDGIPLILPCSPAGYVVSTTTGTFVHGEYCEQLFRTADPATLMDYVIDKFYDGKEQYTWPTYGSINASENKEKKIPIFIDQNGQPKSRRSMWPRLYNCFDVGRNGCDHVKRDPAEIAKIRECEGQIWTEGEGEYKISTTQLTTQSIIPAPGTTKTASCTNSSVTTASCTNSSATTAPGAKDKCNLTDLITGYEKFRVMWLNLCLV